MPATHVSNEQVRSFWEKNPVAASGIVAEPGSAAFFARFDALREAPDCEPWDYSNRIHGYTESRGRRVLDIGCGNGYVLVQYARHGAEAHGIDLTETAVGLSRRRFELAGLSGTFQRTDGDTIPYPDATFDIVCAMGVLHHIEDPRPMLREIRRVLRPGGDIILMMYHRNSWKHRIVHPLKRLLDPRYRGKTLAQVLNMNDGPDCPLALVYSKSELRHLLSGFDEIRFDCNQLSWQQLLLVPGLGRALTPVLPSCSESIFARHLGWNLYARARKPIGTA
jgi:SAM-dependent methyltransferase